MNETRGFYDTAEFGFVARLERGAPAIRSELDRLLDVDPFIPWPEKGIYNRGWDVFGLYFFGRKDAANCARCPDTAKIVESVPGMTTAGFSRLAPGTHIRPHTGYTGDVLRCHLGLIAPPGCRLRVGGETRAWEESKCLVFDDTLEHEAWNESGDERVVLLLDFRRPA